MSSMLAHFQSILVRRSLFWQGIINISVMPQFYNLISPESLLDYNSK